MTARRVLIAEDQAIFSQLLEKWLTSAGLTVRTVVNGEEAVAACKQWRPDLVSMVLRMISMSGMLP